MTRAQKNLYKKIENGEPLPRQTRHDTIDALVKAGLIKYEPMTVDKAGRWVIVKTAEVK